MGDTAFVEVDSDVQMEYGHDYRATFRINKSWQSWYSAVINATIHGYDLLNEKVKVKSIAYNFHTEVTNPKMFDVIVIVTPTKGGPSEAGLSGTQIGALIAGGIFTAILAAGVLINFEEVAAPAIKTVFNPGTIILAVVALFLILRYGRSV